MSDFDPVEAGAEALTQVHYGHLDEEDYAEFIKDGIFRGDARAVLAAALDRDELARVLAMDDAWLLDVREDVESEIVAHAKAEFYAKADTIRAWALGES